MPLKGTPKGGEGQKKGTFFLRKAKGTAKTRNFIRESKQGTSCPRNEHFCGLSLSMSLSLSNINLTSSSDGSQAWQEGHVGIRMTLSLNVKGTIKVFASSNASPRSFNCRMKGKGEV